MKKTNSGKGLENLIGFPRRLESNEIDNYFIHISMYSRTNLECSSVTFTYRKEQNTIIDNYGKIQKGQASVQGFVQPNPGSGTEVFLVNEKDTLQFSSLAVITPKKSNTAMQATRGNPDDQSLYSNTAFDKLRYTLSEGSKDYFSNN